ncbi:MAG: hypothetical protein F6K40_38465, partial [Okeania sp. SIO3I5]|nr:hypothetical protein [Okeania sp. SIO3I5]
NLGWVLLNIKNGRGEIQNLQSMQLAYGKALELYKQQDKLTLANLIKHTFQIVGIAL